MARVRKQSRSRLRQLKTRHAGNTGEGARRCPGALLRLRQAITGATHQSRLDGAGLYSGSGSGERIPCSRSCRCMNAGIMIMLRTYDFNTLIEQMAANENFNRKGFGLTRPDFYSNLIHSNKKFNRKRLWAHQTRLLFKSNTF